MQFMPYKFSFDLSGIPNSFYAELARVASEHKILRKFDMVTFYKLLILSNYDHENKMCGIFPFANLY